MSDIVYTLALTSCARHDLLRWTLDSFIKYADVKPVATVIVEDGGVDAPGWLYCDHQNNNLPNKTYIKNDPKRGQVASIDRAYAEIKTEYLFWAEDDWQFLETGFIRQSYDILRQYSRISQVDLRGPSWGHTLIDDPRYPFKIAEPGWGGGYGGLAWNPGLRRLSDYKKVFGTFMQHKTPAEKHSDAETARIASLQKPKPSDHERNAWKETYFSQMMLDENYNIASLNKEFVIHTGRHRPTDGSTAWRG
jgi:hypothetical protein